MRRVFLLLLLCIGPAAVAEETPKTEEARAQAPHVVQSTCTPETCPHCRTRAERLVETLARVAQLDDAGLRAEVKQGSDSLETTYGKIYLNPYVSKCLYGLALMAAGSTTKTGKHARVVAGCAKYALADLLKDDKAFSGYRMYPWELAFGVLFLSEVHDKNAAPALEAALRSAAQAMRANRLESGGWEKLSSKMGNYELLVSTNAQVAALARLSDSGIKLSRPDRARILNYYKRCAFRSGGMAYSLDTKGSKAHETYRVPEAGRTAGALLALDLLRARDEAVIKRARIYLESRVEEINESHGSLQLHRLFGGIACFRLGGRWWRTYREKVLSERSFPRTNYNYADCGIPHFEAAVDVILLHAPARRLSILKVSASRGR